MGNLFLKRGGEGKKRGKNDIESVRLFLISTKRSLALRTWFSEESEWEGEGVRERKRERE